MITILLQKILTSLTSLLTGLVTSLTAIDEALDVPVIVKTVTGAVCNFTANIARRCYSVKTTILFSGGGGSASDPIAIVGADSVTVYQSGSDISQSFATVVEFDETCYGGEIDFITGKLTLTHFFLESTWGDGINVTDLGDYVRKLYKFSTPGMCKYPPTTARPQKCNVAPYKSNYAEDSNHFYCNSNEAILFMPEDTADNTVVQFVAELNEPIIIDLYTINITPEIGENNIWTDTGNDTTVIYYEKLEV